MAQRERQDMHLVHLLKPSMILRFGQLHCLLSLSLILFFKFRLKVQTEGGVQYVTTNITQMTSPVPFIDPLTTSLDLRTRVAQISIATATHFCTTTSDAWNKNWPAGHPSFLKVQSTQGSDGNSSLVYVWGDVLKGIEEISHNVTAALLTLPLGKMNVSCFYDHKFVVY